MSNNKNVILVVIVDMFSKAIALGLGEAMTVELDSEGFTKLLRKRDLRCASAGEAMAK